MRAAHVWLIADLHRAGGVEVVGGQDSARAMVFVAARKDSHAAGGESGDYRVSRESGKGHTIPGEAAARVLNPPIARLWREPISHRRGHHRSSSRRTTEVSSVSVCVDGPALTLAEAGCGSLPA